MDMNILFRILLMGSLAAFTTRVPAQSPPATSGAAAVHNTMAQRMQACVMCHGKQGRATQAGYFPRIAGKPEGYLFNQLKNFREGRRRNRAMNHLTQHMSDDYLRDIARYFSALDVPYPPALWHTACPHGSSRPPSSWSSRGRRSARSRRAPRVTAASMAGRLPAMPGLVTLPADYLIGQLGAWRSRLAGGRSTGLHGRRRQAAHQRGSGCRGTLAGCTEPAGRVRSRKAASAEPLPVRLRGRQRMNEHESCAARQLGAPVAIVLGVTLSCWGPGWHG
jgi:cytochrome c553